MTPTKQQLIDAIASTSTKTAAISILGIDKAFFYKLIERYKLTETELTGLPKPSKITISKEDLLVALERNNYHQINTAKDLGVVKSTVGVWMVEYGIKKVPRKEQVTVCSNYKPLTIPKLDIVAAINDHSNIKDAAIRLGISKCKLYEYIKHYDIPTKQSKNKEKNWDEIRNKLFEQRVSVIEVCEQYDITKENLKTKNIDVSELTTEYTIEELKRILSIIDFNNQGVIKKLKLLDVNVEKSIMRLTNNHIVSTDKLTERCYRLVNDYQPEQIDECKWCGDNLLFYTFQLGYGNSGNNTCERCHTNVSGISPASQKLFWDIYNVTNCECWFSELNREFVFDISEEDKLYFNNSELLNKSYYAVDFLWGNYVIEYGSDYFRKIIEKMNMRKKFLEYKGYKVLFVSWIEHQKYPEETLQKCLDFLKS